MSNLLANFKTYVRHLSRRLVYLLIGELENNLRAFTYILLRQVCP
jgi:hypothetical protein